MGTRSYCPIPHEPVPRQVWLELTCDGDHGLLDPPSQTFRQAGALERWAAAMAAGWQEAYHPGTHGRALLCPSCSGKKPRGGLAGHAPEGSG